MAAVFHSLTTPRSSPPITASAFTISSIGRTPAVRLPDVRGLRVCSPSPTIRSFGSLSHNSSRSTAAPAGRILCEAQDTAVEVLNVTEKTWDSLVLKSESAVLVEFWAPWCGPCRMIHPVIDSLSWEYAGKLKCYKLNTDESPSIATRYGIRSIPTVMIFKGGEKKDAIIGAVPKTTLISSIEKFL